MSSIESTVAAAGVAAEDPAAQAARGAVYKRRFRSWTGILAAYFGSQTLTQLLGIASGIIFVRWMPVGEFALYTLGSSVITFLAFTTDLGSTGSLVHFYRRAREEGDSFEHYLAAVLSLRRRVFVLAAAFAAIGFPIIAIGKGFSPLSVALAAGAVLLAVGLQISASVRVLALRLDDRYGLSYKAELGGAALRLLLALAMLASALMHSWIGLLVAAAGSALVSWLARPGKAALRSAPAAARVSPRYRRAVLRYLLPTLPSALYYSVQGPLVVWLAATFGGARNIAEVGALGRLGLVVGIFGSLTSIVFVPRLARITDEVLWRRRALQFGAVQTVIGVILISLAAIAPSAFLWIIGPRYSALSTELLLVLGSAGVMLVGGYLVALNMSRGWTRLQGVATVGMVGAQGMLVALLPLSTTSGVLSFNLLSAVAGTALQLAILSAGALYPALVTYRD
jgi:O-antigen/teichoic acid export membrane protein